jgi:hypothetical protein
VLLEDPASMTGEPLWRRCPEAKPIWHVDDFGGGAHEACECDCHGFTMDGLVPVEPREPTEQGPAGSPWPVLRNGDSLIVDGDGSWKVWRAAGEVTWLQRTFDHGGLDTNIYTVRGETP